jgi:hypothetical protein
MKQKRRISKTREEKNGDLKNRFRLEFLRSEPLG